MSKTSGQPKELIEAAIKHSDRAFYPIHECAQILRAFIAGAEWQQNNDRQPVFPSIGEKTIVEKDAEIAKLNQEIMLLRSLMMDITENWK